MPRPKFEPTAQDRTYVARAVAYGMPLEIVRQIIVNPETGNAVSEMTFRRAFREEIRNGLAQTVHAVATSLVRQAVRGNVVAQIFFLKARAGWKETNIVEQWVGGVPGRPIEVKVSARGQLYDALDQMGARRESLESGHLRGNGLDGEGPPPKKDGAET
jgi:hypothetical protein